MLAEASRAVSFVLGHPIGQRRPLSCLASLVDWQVRARLKPDARCVPFVGDLSLWARRGETGVTGNIYVGLHEFADMGFVAHVLRAGDLFADIGANAGSYSVLAAGITGAEVVAVEPAPDAFARLQANIALNNLEHLVQPQRCALGSTTSVISFSAGQDTTNHVIDDQRSYSGPMTEVEMYRMEDLFERRVPNVIKIDVEGFENDVLIGAGMVLRNPNVKALIVEIWNQADSHASEQLEALGFTRATYDPFSRSLTDTAARNGANTLFVRDRAWVVERVATAPKLAVKGLAI